jgi:hypothetical protein
MILNYPVISFADSLTHHGSRFNLIGNMEQSEFDKAHGRQGRTPTRIWQLYRYLPTR